MWTSNTWQTEDDVERDILLLAEYSVPTAEDLDPVKNRVPDTILQYRKQIAQNKERTLNGDLDDNASYIVSGRGKGIHDRVIRPGGIVDTHPLDEVLLKKQIRQVSGFGYSNELIEQSIRAQGFISKDDKDDTNFKFTSPSTSSNKSSVETTPTKRKKGDSDMGCCNVNNEHNPSPEH